MKLSDLKININIPITEQPLFVDLHSTSKIADIIFTQNNAVSFCSFCNTNLFINQLLNNVHNRKISGAYISPIFSTTDEYSFVFSMSRAKFNNLKLTDFSYWISSDTDYDIVVVMAPLQTENQFIQNIPTLKSYMPLQFNALTFWDWGSDVEKGILSILNRYNIINIALVNNFVRPDFYNQYLYEKATKEIFQNNRCAINSLEEEAKNYHDPIMRVIMEEPIKYTMEHTRVCNNQEEKFTFTYSISKNSYEKLPKNPSTGKHICPFTKQDIQSISENKELNDKIQKFITKVQDLSNSQIPTTSI